MAAVFVFLYGRNSVSGSVKYHIIPFSAGCMIGRISGLFKSCAAYSQRFCPKTWRGNRLRGTG